MEDYQFELRDIGHKLKEMKAEEIDSVELDYLYDIQELIEYLIAVSEGEEASKPELLFI